MPRGGPIDRTKLWCLTYTGFVQHLLTNKSLSNDLYRHFGSYCEGSHPVPKVHFLSDPGVPGPVVRPSVHDVV